MSHILKLFHTNALNLSRTLHLGQNNFPGLHSSKGITVSKSYPVQTIKKHKSTLVKEDHEKNIFSVKDGVDEEKLNELDQDNNEVLVREEVNEGKLTELSTANEGKLTRRLEEELDGSRSRIEDISQESFFTRGTAEELDGTRSHTEDMSQESFFTRGTAEELDGTRSRAEDISQESFFTRGIAEELDGTRSRTEDIKQMSFITRDEVKKALLDVYGKANDNMLNKIMSVNNTPSEEISLHQFESKVEQLLMVDKVFQENFPKKVFFEYDKNQDGKLNSKEIKVVLNDIGENFDKKRLKYFMKNYDKDEDGYLNYEEFCEFTRKELFPR